MLPLIAAALALWQPNLFSSVPSRGALLAITASELKVTTYAPLASAAAMTLEERLGQLRALTATSGQAMPTADNADESLVRWAARQRALRKSGTLPADVIDALESVSFVWDPLQAAWDARYEELEEYYATHGHCNVPTSGAGALGGWVSRQRALYRQGTLRKDRRKALRSLDFEFDPLAARWERKLAEYAKATRKAKRSKKATLPEQLAGWASRQRAAHMAGKLPPERVEALNQLEGWSWRPAAVRGSPNALAALGKRLTREARVNDIGGSFELLEGESVGTVAASSLSGARCYPAANAVGRALCVSIGARREAGAAAELIDAREALRSLGYEVITVENPSASELTASLLAHVNRDGWEGHGSSVVALMGHGVGGLLECQDGNSTSLRGLFGLLASAPSLHGKPKICLVQACRKGERPMVISRTKAWRPNNKRVVAEEEEEEDAVAMNLVDAVEGAAAEEEEGTARLHEEHDFLWGYATSPGNVAYRGALFSALRSVVKEHGMRTPWIELLHLTNEKLNDWSHERRKGMSPLPSMEISSTLRGAAFSPSDLVSAISSQAETDGMEMEEDDDDEEEESDDDLEGQLEPVELLMFKDSKGNGGNDMDIQEQIHGVF